MAKRMLFIYNPFAGKGQIKNKLFDIINTFAKSGYEITVHPTENRGDGARTTKEKIKNYDILVCSGGDGTLDEVVTGMMESRKSLPIGYIPAGSTNDFANSLSLPKNMVRAAEIITEGEEFACDVGAFNNDTFVYIAAFGMLTDVSYETPQEIKNVLGHMAYILEGMKRFSLRAYHMRISCEDIVLEDDFLFGMITNSTSVGGFKRITGKYVELNDGLFEVTLVKKPKSAMELNQIMTALVSGNIDADCMHCFKTAALVIESEEVAWTLDGEYGGKHEKVTIENKKEAIRIFVPKQ